MVGVRPNISEREIGHLVSAPHVAVQLIWACQGSVFSPQDLQKIILQDSAFSAKIINAAVKACPERINPSAPLSSALESLSLSVIKGLAIQSARRLVESNFTSAQALFLQKHWFYSQVGRIASGCIAEAIAYPDVEEARLTGVLMNIGQLTLFSKNPGLYLDEIGTSRNSTEAHERDQFCLEPDHVDVADTLVSGWRLESFMADAISFLPLDIDQCRESTPLIRIARMSLEICRSPYTLNAEILLAGKTLFNFTRSETAALFESAGTQYRNLSPSNLSGDDYLEEIRRVQKRLTSVVFSLANLEDIRSQLADSVGMEDFVGAARHLYLHHSVAREAVFFIADDQNIRISGFPSSGQSRLVGELSTPLSARNLLTEALAGGQIQHTFERGGQDFSMFDRQLIRLCKGRGVVCVPLRAEGQLLGGVALGVESMLDAEHFAEPQIQLLNGSVAKGLASLMAVRSEVTRADSLCADANVIPKLAHEINNPLAIINNYMSVVGTLLEGSEHAEILPAIEIEIKRIGDILQYYTELKGPPQPPEAALVLNDLILSVVESLTPTFFIPNQIEIHTDLDSSIRQVKTKSVAIKQILINLLKNAAEALNGGGRIVLTSRAYITSDSQRFADVRIQDNGPGIDKRIQSRLFDPVTSTKGGEHAGLGLNIVKGMVDDIGAKISCHSSPEFGTSFNLLIPINGE